MGMVWLLTSFLFLAAMFLYFTKNIGWAVVATIAVVASQILIIAVWKDAKFGSISQENHHLQR